jgi:two-component system cell cycle response regulator
VKVLVADDDEITRVTLHTLLTKRGYEVLLAKDGIEAFELLGRPDAPSIAILDWLMPGLNGIELCRRIRASPQGPYTYVMILSALGEKRHFKIGMDAGADDYLSKPFDAEELHLRLRVGERVITLQERLRVEAHADALTNTLNRGAIMELLRRGLAQAARHDEPLSVILADVDNFKGVNDTYGHPVGDAVLQHVANSIRAPLRSYDAFGRYGGEEFLIVSPSCTVAEAAEVAERVRASVEATPFAHPSGAIRLTISMGVAGACGGQLQSQDLIVLADKALYAAKNRGRNRVVLADEKSAARDRRAGGV